MSLPSQHYVRDRAVIILSAAAAGLLAWGICAIAGAPRVSGYGASLFLQASPALAIVAAVLGVLAGAVAATWIGARVHRDMGLFAAALGLSVLAVRGGPITPLLRERGASLYGFLAAEIIALAALLALAAWVVARLTRRQPRISPPGERRSGGLQALALQTLITAFAMLLLARSADKKTALAAAGISGLVGSLVAHGFVPLGQARWYWPGPLLAGFVGYIWAMLAPGPGTAVGLPLNGLASAAPLDFASLGVAGAVWGFWMSQMWAAERAHQQALTEPAARSAQPAPL